jgi:cell shape-determining protein MreD
MRFIVDIYRFVILGGIGLAIVGIVYVAMKLFASDQIDPRYGLVALLVGAIVLLMVVMALGVTATIISIHDRHQEIVEELRALNQQREA